VAWFGDDRSEISVSRPAVELLPAMDDLTGEMTSKVLPAVAFLAARCQGFDTQAVSDLVERVLRKHRRPQEPVTINVDTIGYGAGVYDALVRRKRDCNDGSWDFINICSFNVSESPVNDEDAVLKRDEMWFDGAKWLKTGALCPDGHLETQLLAPTYQIVAKGKRKVESKKEVKSRLGESTDGADSVLMSIASHIQRPRAVPESLNRNPLPESQWGMDQSRGFG
jgi:hypothetical protein